ncbi:flagellar hook-associated protein 2 [Nitrosomonas sp. Nm51]|uniref:flagellar filament capping protein FliD n=1 Tax=Nitrosomonas sp. Nm51 TaxID=133720 RepID=UPI0008AD4E0D|nr:flagellar filament capping protein FliD [Nitrosomonas sp. Nm51]SER24650.1 flagellar hook-associated protein 2 [Nitrosomonas sp. Nm51]
MLSTPGIGSGLDVNGIVSQLMSVERRPLLALDTKEARQQTQLTAFGTLKGALSSFQSSLASLTSPEKFSANSAALSDTSLASVSANSSATTGSYDVEIQSLAQSQKLKSGNFASSSSTLGSGTLTIQFGTYNGGTFTLNPEKAAQAITVSPTDSSLAGIRDAINKADAGISASIINDGSGDRLVIASKDTGLSNALKITVTDDDGNNTDNLGLSQLAYDASASGVSNLTETVAAGNAEMVIDGISISKASNTITDAIEGVTFNLLKDEIGTTATLNITRNTAGIEKAVSNFVNSFNELNQTITDLSKYNAETKQASILTGDFTVRALQNQLRNALSEPLKTAGGGLSILAEIGVSFQEDGSLKLDASKLSNVINDTSKDISTLFASVGKPSDSLVSFVSATSDTAGGNYQLDISQLATQGAATGSIPAALTINAGVNDTLDFTINGTSASIILAAGTYNADSLAAEIQSKINGESVFETNNISVNVTQSAGTLTITSDQYGSSSSIEITGGNGELDLFGTAVETAGLDVAGTINGASATGSGQTLTGTGDSEGLALQITGGSTGSRGAIDFAHGFAAKLDQVINKMLDGKLIDNRIEGINAKIDDINDQRESLIRRLDDVEKRIRAQFSALDTMIASMTQTSTFLQQQLSRLPTIDSN